MDARLFNIIADFFKDLPRQGPGSTRATKWALSRIADTQPLNRILDIGCGTGAQTMILGQETNAQIDAVDRIPMFLDILKNKCIKQGWSDRVQLHNVDMDKLPFEENSFDLIWSEGAIYNMGFTYGLKHWKHLLKPGGFMVVSEISWATEHRPEEVNHYWNKYYPEMSLVSDKIRVMEMLGYTTIGSYALPDVGWRNYYQPIREKLQALKDTGDKELQDFMEQIKMELRIFDNYHKYYNYFFYIMRKED